MQQEIFKKNEIIFKQGDAQNWMYGILKGSVAVYVNYGKADEKQLTVLKAGSYLGELGLFDASPRSATAVALEEGTQLELVYIDNLAGWLRNNSDSALDIMRNVSGRIRSVSYELLELRRTAGELVREEKRERGWLKKSFKKFAALGRSEDERPAVFGAKAPGIKQREAEIKNYKKGEFVFRQGEASECMYELVSGKVGIYDGYGSENQREITVLESGKIFGEMGLLEELPRSADALCLEDCRLIPVGVWSFDSWFRAEPKKSVALMQQMSERLRELTQEYEKACDMFSKAAEAEEKDGTVDPKFMDVMDDYSKQYDSIYRQAVALGIDVSGLRAFRK